jgi:hypothetical protein
MRQRCSGVQQHEQKARSAIGSWQRGDATGQPAVAWTEQLGVGARLEFHRWAVRRGAGEGDGFGRSNACGNGSGPITGLLADRLRGSGPLGKEFGLYLKKINFYSIQNQN